MESTVARQASHHHKHHHHHRADWTYIKDTPESEDDYEKDRSELKDAVEVHEYKHRHHAEEEKGAQLIFDSLVKKIVKPTYNPAGHDFYDVQVRGRRQQEEIEKSELFHKMREMPKGAVLHLHSTAAVEMEFLIKEYTYSANYWLSQEKKDLKYSKTPLEGYKEIVGLRESMGDVAVDAMLKEMMILGRKDIKSKESMVIWDEFQYKFTMTGDLFNLKTNFKKNIKQMFEECLNDGIDHAQFRHAPGLVFDEDHQPVSVEQEFGIIQAALDEFQKAHAHFTAGFIICSLKFLGKEHIEKVMQDAFELKAKYGSLVVGLDSVCEEDRWVQSVELADVFMKKGQLENKYKVQLPYIFHGGESVSRANENLYDVVMLGTKRIGHGFGLFIYPRLIQTVRERNICIECCPISNQVLGYVKDLRCHPARMLMNLGVPLTISSDDPAFFNYSGITHDFVLATLAWQLRLSEIKTLCLNSIKFSELGEEEKLAKLTAFQNKWYTWIQSF